MRRVTQPPFIAGPLGVIVFTQFAKNNSYISKIKQEDNRMTKTFNLISFCILFLFSCAPIQKSTINTQSGKPEVSISNVPKKRIADELVNQMLSQGFSVKSSSDYSIVFIKPLDNVGASLLLGSRYDVTPEHRVIMNIVESNNIVRIVANNQAITNPGSAFERVTDLSTGNAGDSWQKFLTSFAGLFIGKIGVEVNEQGLITKVVDPSPAAQSGLKVNDMIISVDGKPFVSISQISGVLETSVEIIVMRNNEKFTFNITRKLYPFN
jgi:membrane-associated protease RseP (regulator of RpoE activity)